MLLPKCCQWDSNPQQEVLETSALPLSYSSNDTWHARACQACEASGQDLALRASRMRLPILL
ncbi:MAG: hypothetical protein K2Z81_01435, partial [Cyanobacteria bacterium]|nr:hypothetical protein [Cyanobacteriota bacterium]